MTVDYHATLSYYTYRKFLNVNSPTNLPTCSDTQKRNAFSSAERIDGEIDLCNGRASRGEIGVSRY